jgi:cytochrome c-type protein NapC
MHITTGIVIAAILISIGLLAVILFAPGITVGRTGKIVAFMAILVLPALSTSMGYSNHLERAQSTTFCLGCHVMENYGKSLHVDDPTYIPAMHFQYRRVPTDQACYTCHTDYTMFGGFRSKMRGLRHIWIQYLGTVPKPEDIKLYNGPYDSRNCLHCHLGARSFEEGATHNMEPGQMEAIKSGKLTCLTSGCHDVTHNVKDVSTWKFWPPKEQP